MFCKKCGREINKDVVFCPHCGAALKATAKTQETKSEVTQMEMTKSEESKGEATDVEVYDSATQKVAAATAQEAVSSESHFFGKLKNKFTKMQLTVIAVAAVAIVALITLMCLISRGGSDWAHISEDAVTLVKIDGDYKIQIAKSGKLVKGPDIDGYSGIAYSMDKSVLYLLDNENDLYVINKKGAVKVAENVAYCNIAAAGESLVYVTEDSGEYSVFTYNIGKKKSTAVAKELKGYRSVIVSPDGKSVAYTDEERKCHVVINGKEQDDKIKDAEAIAIADGGAYLYYLKNDNFWVKKKKSDDAEKLGSSIYAAYFNSDLSQVLYSYSSDGDYKTYFAEKGKKADEIVGKGRLEVVTPDSAQFLVIASRAIALGREDLKKLVAVYDDDLYYINRKAKAEKIISNYDEYTISDDGTALVIRKNEKLYRVGNLDKSIEPKQLGEKLEVRGFLSDGDLDSIYFRNSDREIFYIKGTKNPKKVYDDTYSDWLQVGDNLYFVADDELFVSQGGGKRVKLSSADDVSELWEQNGAVYYEADRTVYLVEGKKAKKLYEK